MELGTLLLGLAIALCIIVLVDLFVLGGAVTRATLRGIAAMMGTPWGWAILLAVVGLVIAVASAR